NILIFYTAARGTFAARFYYLLSKNLSIDIHKLFILDPARTPVVKRIAVVGLNIIRFWIIIGLTITMLIPLIYGFAMSPLKCYILIMVPISAFFSPIFGSFTFFRNWY